MSTEEEKQAVSILTLADGEVVRQIDEALQEMFEDINDPNTEAKANREVNLKISLMPDAEREVVISAFRVTKKTPGMRPTTSKIMLGLSGGKVVAQEFPKRQTELDYDNVTDISTGKGDK